MKKINLTNSNSVVLLDDEDFYRLGNYKWHLSAIGYAVRFTSRTTGRRECQYLHRQVLMAKRGSIVDHINRNKLDCRKLNLRTATRRENAFNSKKLFKSNTSGFKGVYFSKQRNKWIAQGAIENRKINLGGFDHKHQAIRKRIEWIKSQKVIWN